MAGGDNQLKRYRFALIFMGVALVIAVWNIIIAVQEGTVDQLFSFNFDMFGGSEQNGDSLNSLVGAIIIICALAAFLIAVIRGHKDEVKEEHEREILDADITDIDAMTQQEFSVYMVELFKIIGYPSEAVEGEKGVNVILHRGEEDDVTIYLPLTKEKISDKYVKECVAARDRHGATEGWIITNSKFERNTIKFAQSNKLRLVDRRILIGILDRASREHQQVSTIMRIE